MGTVRLGTNPIAWSNDDMRQLGGETPLETCLAEAREAGFTGIEKGNKFPNDPAALKAVLGKYGLEFVSGWYSGELRHRTVEQEVAAMRPHLELMKAAGAKVMVWAETSGTVQGNRSVPVAHRPVMADS
jgi:inosose dehydratase